MALVLGLILIINFVAAQGFDYKEKFVDTRYSGDLSIVSKTTWVNYDNDDRYPTYDYRHGYSYRATREYFERSDIPSKLGIRASSLLGNDKFVDDEAEFYNKRFSNQNNYYDSRTRNTAPPKLGARILFSLSRWTYYEYIPYMKSYNKQDCYVMPPADRLFYIKC